MQKKQKKLQKNTNEENILEKNVVENICWIAAEMKKLKGKQKFENHKWRNFHKKLL